MNINELKDYIQCGMSILIEGPHGVGKTSSLREVCDKLGYKMWYANMSTIDINTHIIGIPVINDEKTDLTMVRPHEIDTADVIFLDEINRTGGFAGDVMNAVMELVNDGAINGEKLPNLKAVVAACNPDDGTYNVNPIDPATIDRFDVFLRAEPKVDAKILTQECGNAEVARAVVDWHRKLDHNSAYVSPRRLGRVAQGAVKVPNFTINTCRALIGPEASSLPIKALHSAIAVALKGEPKQKPAPKKADPKKVREIEDQFSKAFDSKGEYIKASGFFEDGRARKAMQSMSGEDFESIINNHQGFTGSPVAKAARYTNVVMKNISFFSVALDYIQPAQKLYHSSS